MKKILYAVILLLCVSMVTSTMNSCKKNTDAVENNGGSNNGGGNNGGGNGGGGNGTYNGHDYVDLGLPSGTLWATCNVGATTPEGYGNFYSWGETTTKTSYSRDNYKYYKNGDDHLVTKYCCKAEYGFNGFTDNLNVLQSSDDAAIANWGSGWRTPTKEEWIELYENTTHGVAFQNNVKGYKFTANNGQTLFLPAAGTGSENVIDDGEYWSCSLYNDKPYKAWAFMFLANLDDIGDCSRYHGSSVRPVRTTH